MARWRRAGIRSVLAAAVCLCGLFAAAGAVRAQQPAQRVLPRVTPPSALPQGRSPCLPTFDEELRLYLRPCQEFHDGQPGPDWLDRMMVALTWRALAVFGSDLDALEREQAARYRVGSAARLNEPPAAAVADSERRWDAYLVALQRHLQEAGLVPVPGHRRPPGPPADAEAVAAAAAAFKESEFPGPTATPLWTPTGGWPVTAPWSALLEARAGDAIEVTVRALARAPGYLRPDPVVWLVSLDSRGDPERGEVLAVADDAESGTLTVRATAPREGDYRVIIAPYGPAHAGLFDGEARVDGVLQAVADRTFFGGTALRAEDLAEGDLVFAGADGDAGESHDGLLVLLPPPGSALPAPYAASNNDIGTLPFLRMEQAREAAWLLVGAFSTEVSPRLQVVLSRAAPGPGEGRGDEDGDGLSKEVEALLGSCDSVDAGEQGTCTAPTPLPDDWDPADTDHDGFSDLEELHGIRRCFTAPGTPPLHAVDACLRDDEGRCLRDCPAEAGMIAQLPLSAMDRPHPCVHDIYLELDYWQGSDEEPGAHALSEEDVRRLRRGFEERFVHVPGERGSFGRFEPTRYPIAFHLYQDEPLTMPGFEGVSRIPALPARSLFFDLFFTPDRKYAGVFHYMVGSHKGGGQSDVLGRAAIVGVSGGTGLTMKFLHEAGHLLGLQHNHALSNPDHTPFHLSLMSYGYVHTMPPPVAWDGEFRPCSGQKPCPDLFRCVSFPGHGSLCAPDCGVVVAPDGTGEHFARFSSGEMVLPEGTSEAETVPEQGYPQWFLPYLYCWDGAGRNSHRDRLRRFTDPACREGRCVVCDASGCAIDWDRDGDFDGVTGFDLDGDGKLNERRLGDGADHDRLLALGRRGLRVLWKRSLAAYYADFGGGRADNFLPYPAVTHENHGGFVADVTNRCDEVARWSHCRDEAHLDAALFRGPASGDRAIEVRFPDEYCLESEGGLTVTLRVKPFQAPEEGFPVTLLEAGEVRMLLESGADGLRWVAELGTGGEQARLELPDTGALGRWTRLTLALDGRREEAVWAARRGTIQLRRELEGRAAVGRICTLSIGAAESRNSDFVGLLDDPMLILGFVKSLP